jgi:surface antigen
VGVVIMKIISCILAVVMVVAFDAAALAQINPFARGDSGVTRDDAKFIEEASSKIYKADNPQVGATEKWSNPGTGNSGTVSLIQLYEKDGMPCRKLRHRISTKGSKDPQIYIFSRCRVKSGEWKLL